LYSLFGKIIITIIIVVVNFFEFGKSLCVGVSYATSFEVEAFAGVCNAAASSVCVPENRNDLGVEGGEDFNQLEKAESGNTFFKKSAIKCI